MKVARHASRMATPRGAAFGAAWRSPPPGCGPMLLPAASTRSEGGERGAGFAAHKSRCC